MKSKDKKGPSPPSPILLKALKSNQQWEEKEDFLNVVYWMRQVLSFIVGLTCGIIPLQGFIGMLVFLIVSGGLVYLYCILYQGVDQEEYGGAWELLKEGMMTAFAIFLLIIEETQSLSTYFTKKFSLLDNILKDINIVTDINDTLLCK